MFVKEYKIPKDVKIEIKNSLIKVTGPKGELEKKFDLPEWIKIEVNDKFRVECKSERRKHKALAGTIAAHVRNMIIGVTQGFTYKLKIIYAHFPINLKIEGKKIIIQNFLGERTPRIAKIVGDTDVKIEKDEIIVTSKNIEHAGQTAANLEQATKIIGKDRRVFQDGIFIVEKPKRLI